MTCLQPIILLPGCALSGTQVHQTNSQARKSSFLSTYGASQAHVWVVGLAASDRQSYHPHNLYQAPQVPR
jgi:hypothetical protein